MRQTPPFPKQQATYYVIRNCMTHFQLTTEVWVGYDDILVSRTPATRIDSPYDLQSYIDDLYAKGVSGELIVCKGFAAGFDWEGTGIQPPTND